MNKYCWEYRDRETMEIIVVQRPHRRAIDPKYYAYRMIYVGAPKSLPGNLGAVRWYFALTADQLSKQYVFVGRKKS